MRWLSIVIAGCASSTPPEPATPARPTRPVSAACARALATWQNKAAGTHAVVEAIDYLVDHADKECSAEQLDAVVDASIERLYDTTVARDEAPLDGLTMQVRHFAIDILGNVTSKSFGSFHAEGGMEVRATTPFTPALRELNDAIVIASWRTWRAQASTVAIDSMKESLKRLSAREKAYVEREKNRPTDPDGIPIDDQ